jgi:hypothetical protein
MQQATNLSSLTQLRNVTWNSQRYAILPEACSTVNLGTAHKTGGSRFDSRYDPSTFPSNLLLLSTFRSPAVRSTCKRYVHKAHSLGVNAAGAQSYLCRPGCAKCQSKDSSPTFHPPNEFSWFVTGNLYLAQNTAIWWKVPTSQTLNPTHTRPPTSLYLPFPKLLALLPTRTPSFKVP